MPVTTRLLPRGWRPIKHWARTPALFQVPGSSVGSSEGMIMTILTCWLVPTLLLACLLALTLCWALTSLLGSELVPWWAQQLVEHSEQGCVLEPFQMMLYGGKLENLWQAEVAWVTAPWFWVVGFGWGLGSAACSDPCRTCMQPAHLILTGTISSFVKYWITVRTATKTIAENHRLLKEISKVNFK